MALEKQIIINDVNDESNEVVLEDEAFDNNDEVDNVDPDNDGSERDEKHVESDDDETLHDRNKIKTLRSYCNYVEGDNGKTKQVKKKRSMKLGASESAKKQRFQAVKSKLEVLGQDHGVISFLFSYSPNPKRGTCKKFCFGPKAQDYGRTKKFIRRFSREWTTFCAILESTRPKVDVRADDDPVVADAEKGGLPSQHTEAESMAVDKYDGEKASSKQIIASATTSVGQERANDDDEQQGAIADQRVVHPLPMHPLGEEPADVALARPAAPPTSSISGNQTSQPGHEVKSGDTAKITSTVLKPVGEISGNSLKYCVEGGTTTRTESLEEPIQNELKSIAKTTKSSQQHTVDGGTTMSESSKKPIQNYSKPNKHVSKPIAKTTKSSQQHTADGGTTMSESSKKPIQNVSKPNKHVSKPIAKTTKSSQQPTVEGGTIRTKSSEKSIPNHPKPMNVGVPIATDEPSEKRTVEERTTGTESSKNPLQNHSKQNIVVAKQVAKTTESSQQRTEERTTGTESSQNHLQNHSKPVAKPVAKSTESSQKKKPNEDRDQLLHVRNKRLQTGSCSFENPAKVSRRSCEDKAGSGPSQTGGEMHKIIWIGDIYLEDRENRRFSQFRSFPCKLVEPNGGRRISTAQILNAEELADHFIVIAIVPRSRMRHLMVESSFNQNCTQVVVLPLDDSYSFVELGDKMKSGEGVCVQLTEKNPNVKNRLMIIFYQQAQQKFYGVIPRDQPAFSSCIREITTFEKKL